MKKFMIVSCMAFIFTGLAGCGTNASENTEEVGTVSGGGIEEPEVEIDPAASSRGIEESEVEVNPAPSSGSDPADIKEIPVEVEGETEMRKAQFHRSGLGYSIYVLDDYQLVSEEPQRDVIFSEIDDSFFTRVIVHGTDADPNKIKNSIMEHADGEIEEGLEVPLTGVEFALHEIVESNGEPISITHVAKEFNGQLIEFTIFLPSKEPAEGVGPSMWAMLKTVDY
ncbi:hypothetical protein [Alkalihalobacillus deserti]|uniref:hypothetical protein n=1 Tax=Alkalihalobacillus deserti TaxID=2879466 RepID=UPI001D145CC7|nr:hypothetical protein [Alkalihalobacillus deserti]